LEDVGVYGKIILKNALKKGWEGVGWVNLDQDGI
jgi:hypothetical protein